LWPVTLGPPTPDADSALGLRLKLAALAGVLLDVDPRQVAWT
jgi:hypothetical protein